MPQSIDILGVVLMEIMSRCRKTRGDFRLEVFRRALPRVILLMRKIQGCTKTNPRAEFDPDFLVLQMNTR